MERRKKLFAAMAALFALALLLLPAGAFAQEDNRMPLAFLGAFLFAYLIFFLVMYIYWALATQTIANKTNTENAWLAWIPIANCFLWLMIAKKPLWWFILFLIPLVGVVMMIITWMGIAEARNKPSWWGILLIIPLFGILIVPGYLAWSD